jgi:hypothetical protein
LLRSVGRNARLTHPLAIRGGRERRRNGRKGEREKGRKEKRNGELGKRRIGEEDRSARSWFRDSSSAFGEEDFSAHHRAHPFHIGFSFSPFLPFCPSPSRFSFSPIPRFPDSLKEKGAAGSHARQPQGLQRHSASATYWPTLIPHYPDQQKRLFVKQARESTLFAYSDCSERFTRRNRVDQLISISAVNCDD